MRLTSRPDFQGDLARSARGNHTTLNPAPFAFTGRALATALGASALEAVVLQQAHPLRCGSKPTRPIGRPVALPYAKHRIDPRCGGADVYLRMRGGVCTALAAWSHLL